MRFNIIIVWLQVIEIESALSSALSAYFAEPLPQGQPFKVWSEEAEVVLVND